MINAIHIKNFKSYADATLPLAPLTFLIGANASGKSNALEAIQIMSRLGAGDTLNSFMNAISLGLAIRGNTFNWFGNATKPMTLGVNLSGDYISKYEFNVVFDRQRGLKFIGEQVYHYNYNSGSLAVDIVTEGQNGVLAHIYEDEDRRITVGSDNYNSLFMPDLALVSGSRLPSEPIETREELDFNSDELVQAFTDFVFANPSAKAVREGVFNPVKDIGYDGRNTQTVLFNLLNDEQKGIENKEVVLRFVDSFPEQQITDIQFLEGANNDVTVQLEESFGDAKRLVKMGLLSDGTVLALSYIAMVLAAEPGGTVVLEDIDEGIHPGRMKAMLEQLYELAKARDLKLLFTSHNPAMLNALPREAVLDTVFCYREPDTGNSQLVRLGDIQHYPELIAQGGIGDLLAQGLIDNYVKNPATTEERMQQLEDWLKEINGDG